MTLLSIQILILQSSYELFGYYNFLAIFSPVLFELAFSLFEVVAQVLCCTGNLLYDTKT